MPFIQNVSMSDITKGNHRKSNNAVLIQIVDPDMQFPVPAGDFTEVYQFQFLDIEEDGYTNTGDGMMIDLSELAINDAQAKGIALVLLSAKQNSQDVLVHCHAGVCRSGAVAEVAIACLGFDDTGDYRQPNLLVKRKLMKLLNMWYNYEHC
jgi:predicted protein tyrosine phosphatase